MPLLETILATTLESLPALRARRASLEAAALVAATPADFRAALSGGQVSLIAEVKRKSPSAGAINLELDPGLLAHSYQIGGASAISVLTDGPFFGGALSDLSRVAESVTCPVLRKDFLLDEVQLYEARSVGASAVLLIVRALEQSHLVTMLTCTRALGMEALVEIHTAAELARAIDAGATVIGVNARDLDTFTIDSSAAWELLNRIPAHCTAVAESGMKCLADVQFAAAAGADAVLIGGALAGAPEPTVLAHEFSSVPRHAR